MSETPQRRALKNYRKRLAQRGMKRFEVIGREADRDLIRSLARKLADEDKVAQRIRAIVRKTIAGESQTKGGILAALRRSPLTGAGLNLTRPLATGRKIDL